MLKWLLKASIVAVILHLPFAIGLTRQPNFIIILLDDLDERMDSSGEAAMPATKRLLTDRGVTFTHHFVTTPICCPSRVNLLRGQLSHNTNFTDVLGPHGGHAKFRALNLDAEWLPVWLQRAGYNTLYTGKFIVDYTILNRHPAPAGWTVFDALVHPFTFEYYCPAFSLNGGPPRMYPVQYVTDVLSDKARVLLRSAASDPAGRPFFLQVAPPAPHHSMHYDYDASGHLIARHWYPPLPADRHWEQLSGAELPRPPSFNEEGRMGKPEWVQRIGSLTAANITFLEEVFRLRLRTLRAVDEMVEALVTELSSLDLLDSTYLLLTSDNGYHEGTHRMGSGKTTPYEEDIRVPMVMAGPGLRPGSMVESTTQHIDIAPTLLALAGAPLPASLDGVPLPLGAVSDGNLPTNYPYGKPDQPSPRNHLIAEFWGAWDDESIHAPSHAHYPNLTWKAVRVLRSRPHEAYKYVMHCSGEVELYDLVRDPYEQVNLLDPLTKEPHDQSARQIGGWGAWLQAAAQMGGVPARGRGQRDTTTTAAGAGVVFGADAAGPLGASVTAGFAAAARAWTTSAWGAVAAVKGTATSSMDAHSGHQGSGTAPAAALRVPIERGDYAEWLGRMRRRLDAMLAVLAVCQGRSCVEPFKLLHPDGSVADLWAAMAERYDSMYENLEPFTFGRCLRYQDKDNERSAFRGMVVPSCEAAGHGVEGGAGYVCIPGGGLAATQLQGQDGKAGRGNHAFAIEHTDAAQTSTFQLLEAEAEGSAVPLPHKYELITDVYGSSGSEDAMRLA